MSFIYKKLFAMVFYVLTCYNPKSPTTELPRYLSWIALGNSDYWFCISSMDENRAVSGVGVGVVEKLWTFYGRRNWVTTQVFPIWWTMERNLRTSCCSRGFGCLFFHLFKFSRERIELSKENLKGVIRCWTNVVKFHHFIRYFHYPIFFNFLQTCNLL